MKCDPREPFELLSALSFIESHAMRLAINIAMEIKDISGV
jgi:hypothetical protein